MRRHQNVRGQSAALNPGRSPGPVVADPVAKSKILSESLPSLVEHAEAAGLSIIAQHLSKALLLANRVAASGRRDRLANHLEAG